MKMFHDACWTKGSISVLLCQACCCAAENICMLPNAYLSVIKNGVLKIPTLIVELSVFAYCNFSSCLLHASEYCFIFLVKCSIHHHVVTLLIPPGTLALESIFI